MAQGQPTELPKRWPLAVTPENRDATTAKDAKLVNGYLEKDPRGGWQAIKRPGTALTTYGVGAGLGYGIYNWLGDIYTVCNANLYKNGVSVGVGNFAYGCSFSAGLGATPRLTIQGGPAVNSMWRYDSVGGLVAITPPPTAVALTPGLAYVDGTTYVMDTNAVIWGSGINDTTSWNALNYLVAQIEPDPGVALAKQLVYVVALKQWSTEFFYDAGNAAGSPLAPVQGAKINWGCAAASSLQDIDGDLFWLGTTREGSPEVIRLHNLQASVVSTKYVEKLCSTSALTSVTSWSHKGSGHSFYGLTINPGNVTLVYDVKEGTWAQWTNSVGDALTIAYSASLGVTTLVQTSGGSVASNVYRMSETLYTDNNVVIPFDLYTPNFDAGVDRRKTLQMLRVNGDQTQGSTLQIRCNDHDYDPLKWTSFRSLDLGKQRPFLTNCGTFYKRAYHFHHQANTPLRISSVDLQLELGTL